MHYETSQIISHNHVLFVFKFNKRIYARHTLHMCSTQYGQLSLHNSLEHLQTPHNAQAATKQFLSSSRKCGPTIWTIVFIYAPKTISIFALCSFSSRTLCLITLVKFVGKRLSWRCVCVCVCANSKVKFYVFRIYDVAPWNGEPKRDTAVMLFRFWIR